MGFLSGLKKQMTRPCLGDISGLKCLTNSKMTISVINGQVVAWIIGRDDVIIKKEDVKSLNSLNSTVVTDLCNGGRAPTQVSVFKITMKNGDSGMLRLNQKLQHKVLMILQ